MSDETFDDMPLAKVLHDWLEDIGWDAEHKVTKSREASRMFARVNMSGQSYRVYMTTDEDRQIFDIKIYGAVNIPHHRMDLTCRLLNRMNTYIIIGRLAVDDDEDHNTVQYRSSVDVEGSELTVQQIHNMLSAGHATMSNISAMVAVAALTDRSLEECWAELQGSEEPEPEPELEHRVLQ